MEDKSINIDNIDFSYSDTGISSEQIFSGFNMKLPSSKVSVILGPSGCGKTTLLNLISGLLQPQSGSISCGSGVKVSESISVLFQEPRLLPWRTIRKNLEIVLKNQYEAKECREIAGHYLELVGLSDFSDYYPSQLSGGMRQRASIARAFAYPAETILMDEPFQALDLGLKINLTNLFSKLWIEDSRTSIFVTHDINEAILLGDEIYVLSSGRPVEIIEHLTNPESHSERRLDSPSSIQQEKRLYSLLS